MFGVTTYQSLWMTWWIKHFGNETAA